MGAADRENPYMSSYESAMHELTLLSEIHDDEMLPPYFDHVVLPLRRAYAWGVPSSEALQAIEEYAPAAGVVDIGAGTGYWGSLLRNNLSMNVLAFDSKPLHEAGINGFHHLGNEGNALPFMHVEMGGAEKAANHPDRLLLLCWPPRESDGSGTKDAAVAYLGKDALSKFRGDTIAYVGVLGAGEGAYPEGVADDAVPRTRRLDTAGPAFENALKRDFDLVRTVALPNWPPVEDCLTIWRRKGAAASESKAVSGGRCSLTPEHSPHELDPSTAQRRQRAREAALANIRWAGFDRPWLFRWMKRRWAERQSGREPCPEEEDMARRCLVRAPWVLRFALQRVLFRE